MEKFMYLFVDNTAAPTLSPEEMQADMQRWFAWVEKLSTQQRYVGGEPLLPEGKVLKGKNKVMTDGPFVESKELVSGYMVILAKDINEATEMAKECPIFISGGSVAVRPVQKLDM
jgi:hypothetical protein